jgi:FkbM family methyltransferase
MIPLKQSALHRLPWVYNRLRGLKFSVKSKLFRARQVEHEYGGHRFKLHIADELAQGWYDHDWPRLAEIDLLSRNGLQSGALVFDLGAHQNLVAMMLARETGPTGKVVAVEGTSRNAEIGAKNVALNGLANVITRHAVVAEQEGEIYFSESHNGSVSLDKAGFRTSPVPAVTIDGLAREYGNPRVLFLDIEGHEIAALRGARATLATPVTWFIEMHGDDVLAKYGARNVDVLDFFAGNFDLYFRTDAQPAFAPLTRRDDVPASRFYLVAIPSA